MIENCINTTVYLGLGSNLADKRFFLSKALEEICKLERVVVKNKSRLYLTEPQEDPDQPWFLNQVVEICVENIRPKELLVQLQQIENLLGRIRTKRRFGPRCIDIDILMFGMTLVNEPELCIPHPKLNSRAFVLIPLLEIAPKAKLPDGTNLHDLLQKIDHRIEDDKIFQNSMQIWRENYA
jgi:2-amino-4-hydroxy-6-hydroxymethyldihydropteridine diphosphokinase